MADITKCIGEKALDGKLEICPERHGCYRFTCSESVCQPWCNFYEPGFDCGHWLQAMQP